MKSLGIILDDKLFFISHTDNVCKAAHFHVRGIDMYVSTRLAWWQVRWLAPVSTTVTPFSMEHPPEISGSCNESSTRSHGWFPVRGWAITSPRFWLKWTGSPSQQKQLSKSPFWLSGRSRRKKPSILLRCSIFRPHQGSLIVLETQSACEHCQDCVRQSHYPPRRTLSLEQSPDAPY